MIEYIPHIFGGIGLVSAIFTTGYMVSNKSRMYNYVVKDTCHQIQMNTTEQLNEIKVILSRIDGKMESCDYKKHKTL